MFAENIDRSSNDIKMIPLFQYYPSLQKLPRVSLCNFPTPVHKLGILSEELDTGGLYIKRDDLSGEIFGGNKVRKLEFLLGMAQKSGAKDVITFGGAGSNHALATAIYARQLGLRSVSILLLQPNARYVRQNLLMGYGCGAELQLCKTRLLPRANKLLLQLTSCYQFLKHGMISRHFPYIISAGGSSPIGVVGFVNAAFELKKQIDEGESPEPDYIYVASGTLGTAAGLMIGLKAAKLKSRVIPIRVAGDNLTNTRRLKTLIEETNSLLCATDPSFPRVEFAEQDLQIRNDFFGKHYALFTREGVNAITCLKEKEGIKLDGTYTGKAFAAVINDAENGELRNKTILFWDTLNSIDLTNTTGAVNYHDLPKSFHSFFTDEVQPLDMDL
jgi:D-cysteine desulfhydrase